MVKRNSLSIVIPAYNVKDYVGDCLESIRNQSIPFSEVIVIDDGSTDATLDVINQYSDLPKAQFVKTSNNGLGAARNLGASLATSEYLLFVDSDDFIHPQLVQSFLDAISLNHEIDMYAFSSVTVDDAKCEPVHQKYFCYEFDRCARGNEIFSDLIVEGNFTSAAWSYIFRRSLIDWKKGGFPHVIHEDEEFTPRVFIRSKWVHLSPKILYFYRKRSGSIMRSKSFSFKNFLRSRYGYSIAFFSCLSLMFDAFGNHKLLYALLLRLRYLARYAFLPYLILIVKVIIFPFRQILK